MKERTFNEIKDWVTAAGLRARILQCIWSDEVKRLAPSLHDFYVGYVQVPVDIKIDQDSLDVHGGVTFNGEMPDQDGRWVGFDMAHIGDEGLQDLSYAISECENLAAQILEKPLE